MAENAVPVAEEIAPTEEAEAPEKKKVSPVVWIGLGVIGVTILVFVVLLILPQSWRVNLRDAAIVFLVLLIFFFMVIILFMLLVIIWAISRMSDRLDDVLQRGGLLLDEVKGTARTVKGTADFVGERIASPFIRTGSWVAGVGRGVKTLFQGIKEEKEDIDGPTA